MDAFWSLFAKLPPKVSSIHVQGERAYRRAQRGESFNLTKRSITIHELILINWDQTTGKVEINLHCSSGTYVRSIARDLGELLNCGGCLARLRRIHALGFNENLEELISVLTISLILVSLKSGSPSPVIRN